MEQYIYIYIYTFSNYFVFLFFGCKIDMIKPEKKTEILSEQCLL